MALDPTLTSRDYLYGRLLAVAENIERTALDLAEEKRNTNAERLMQKFVTNPYAVWLQIEPSLLRPYIDRLSQSPKGWPRVFVEERRNEITEITNLFQRDDYCMIKALSGEFLLGYHAQKMKYRIELLERFEKNKAKKAVQQQPN